MKTENSLNVLTLEQKMKYQERGYVSLKGLVSEDWLEKLKTVTDAFIEESRSLNGSDKRFDLEPDHSPEAPRIRRLNSPVDFHKEYWEFASKGPFADIAEDILGPDFKFHHSKLNFKWSKGGEEVKWHQDIQFWPHTNYDVITIGVYLEDVTEDMAPMGIIPDSHEGPLYDQYDESGQWTGNIRESDIPKINVGSAEYLYGEAGTITVHNCRCIHGSAPNLTDNTRPLLLCAYSAADALPITNLTNGGLHSEEYIKGGPAKWARFDRRPVLMPPDWSKVGQKSIFAHQQKEAN
jgi:hypothetical protein